jgi:hypothetical protein
VIATILPAASSMIVATSRGDQTLTLYPPAKAAAVLDGLGGLDGLDRLLRP